MSRQSERFVNNVSSYDAPITAGHRNRRQRHESSGRKRSTKGRKSGVVDKRWHAAERNQLLVNIVGFDWSFYRRFRRLINPNYHRCFFFPARIQPTRRAWVTLTPIRFKSRRRRFGGRHKSYFGLIFRNVWQLRGKVKKKKHATFSLWNKMNKNKSKCYDMNKNQIIWIRLVTCVVCVIIN